MEKKTYSLLSINNYHYRRGGSEVVFFEHDALFRDKGWKTAVFSMNHPKNNPSSWEKYFVDEIEFAHSYSLRHKLILAGKVVYSWEAKNKLAQLLKGFQPDIAHIHNIYHHISPSILPLLRQHGVPIVLTAHDLKLGCPAYKMLTHDGICERCINGNLMNVIKHRCIHGSLSASTLVALESSLHRLFGFYKKNIDHIIVPSLFYKKKLSEWGWAEEKLVYIPNYVSADNFLPEYNPGDYFLYFGRLASEKGVLTLIKAALKTNVKLLIVGEGPEQEIYKAAAESSSQIKFVGRKENADLWSIVRSARCVILPSEWYENAPMSVLESYALGKPVIGARIGGITEIVIDKKTGYLFPSGDVNKLAVILERVNSQSNQSIKDMGYNARKFAEANFTKNRYFDEMSALYNSIISD